MSVLAEAVDVSDHYSAVDTSALAEIAAAMAGELGMAEEQADSLVLAARLHDIGKIGVSESILRKKDELLPEELAAVQQHPEIGQRILGEARQLQDFISAILYHHERWDGDGYPERLRASRFH